MIIFLRLLFDFLVWGFALIYGAEGVNIPLMVMPTQLISRTLKNYGADIGDNVRFRSPLVVHNGTIENKKYYQNLLVGNNCYLGRDLFVDLKDKVIIEEYVTISHKVCIVTHTEAVDFPGGKSIVEKSHAPVIIRKNSYIGIGVTILEGVEIGAGTVIAAGALVNKSIPPNSVVAGVPAKVISKRRSQL